MMDAGYSNFLLEVRNVTRDYALPRESLLAPPAVLRALKGVSLQVTAGRSMGIVGESGSGKSTLARLVMALERPTSGQVLLEGATCMRWRPTSCAAPGATSRWCSRTPMARSTRAARLAHRGRAAAALEGASRAQQRERAAEMLTAVGLRPMRWTSTRTSFPAASASASPSRARSSRGPS
jgi:peptide/nickel transport system ATP-binding protein